MTKEDISDDFLQFLFDQLNEGYQEYKKNHPDFAKVVEEEEGKAEAEADKDHCSSCGEWLEGFDTCSQCGRINK